MAGATRRLVTLRPPDYGLDPEALAAAFSTRTRAILLNSPHNPTGKVFSRAELELIAEFCRERDVIAITDEVYEHLTFDGREHVPLATLPGMAERTVTLSSAGKTFSVTGWKIGWATGPAELVAAVRTAKQYLTFVSGAPFQPAIAHALGLPDAYFEAFRADLQAKRDRLCAGLRAAGLAVFEPAGTYFVTTDITPARRGRRPCVLPLASRPCGRRRRPDGGLLRRRGGRPDARPLRVLQAPGGHRRGRVPPRGTARLSAYTPRPCPGPW